MPHSQRKQQQRTQHPQAAKGTPDLGLLYFKADGSQVTIQHCTSQPGGTSTRPVAVPSLRLDLRTGKVWVGPAAPLPGDSPVTLGIVGLLKLERGAILVLVSKAKRVCGLLDGPVYKVEDTTLVAPEAINASPNDLRYASLLQEAMNPRCFGGHLYFSHTANITSSRQRQATAAPSISTSNHAGQSAQVPGGAAGGGGGGGGGGGHRGALPRLGAWWLGGGASDDHGDDVGGTIPGSHAGGGRGAGDGGTLWSRADPRFVWNRELMRPLIEAGAESFALPLMAGYVGQATGATFTLRSTSGSGSSSRPAALAGGSRSAKDDNPGTVTSGCGGGSDGGGGVVSQAPGDLTLITRLAVERPVAGSWRRGADRQGHAAGFSETEVMITLWQPEPQAAPEQAGGPSQQDTGAGRGGQPGPAGQMGADAAAAAAPQGTAVGNPAVEAGGDVGPDGWFRSRTRVAVASYVMARGSAPLFWAAPPDMRPCPAPRGPEDPLRHEEPFNTHMELMHQAYGRNLLLLNLIFGANQRQQLRLHDALQRQVASYSARVRQQRQRHHQQQEALGANDLAIQKDAARQRNPPVGGASATEEGAAASVGDQVAEGPEAATAAASAAAAAEGGATGPSAGVSLLGFPLSAREQWQLASCGAAAARLEREVAELGLGGCRIGAYVAVDEIELAVQVPAAAPPAPPASSSPPTLGKGRTVTCVGRRVVSRQEGVVRVSSGSTASAGGCCEEVDLAQHSLALPVLAEALVTLGAMDDPADMATAHASVMHALAQLWCHQADVLSDQVLGTGSTAGRLLRAAAAEMERRSLGGAVYRWLFRAPKDAVVSAGDRVSRYYYGNFTDARRQDALDLASGAFKMSYPPGELPRRRPPNTTMLQLGILLLLAASIQGVILVFFQRPSSLGEAGMRVLGPAALGALLLLEVLRQGTAYVEQPLLLAASGLYPWVQ